MTAVEMFNYSDTFCLKCSDDMIEDFFVVSSSENVIIHQNISSLTNISSMKMRKYFISIFNIFTYLKISKDIWYWKLLHILCTHIWLSLESKLLLGPKQFPLYHYIHFRVIKKAWLGYFRNDKMNLIIWCKHACLEKGEKIAFL